MAAPYTVNSGNLATITTDFVGIAIAGSDYATARFSASIAGTATVTAQISIDGLNYVSAPYAKKVSAVSANPTVQAISATTLVAADVWEVPLPGNCTNFRLLCAGSGTAVTVSLAGGAPYVTGVPVTATLSDVTEGSIGAGIGTATTALDVSGWNSVIVFGLSPTTQVVTVRALDDAGAVLTNPGSLYTFAQTAAGTLVLSRGSTASATNAVAAGVFVAAPLFAKRISAYLPAAGTVSQGRIRIEAAR